jgi:shikimate kinase
LSRPLDVDAPVFLVGFMAVGKSTVGALLAARWGWELADTDAIVEATEGRTIAEIFRVSGEGRFREMEWEALRAQAARRKLVVATGGGLFLGVPQRAFVRAHGLSCWLDAPLDAVRARVRGPAVRPLWGGDDARAQRAFFERRRAAYALADVRVDAGAGSAETVADAVERARNAFYR